MNRAFVFFGVLVFGMCTASAVFCSMIGQWLSSAILCRACHDIEHEDKGYFNGQTKEFLAVVG